MDEAVILMMILSGIVMLIAYRAKSRVVLLVGSLGWIITGLTLLNSDPETPAYTFMFFVAVAAAPFLLVGDA